MKSIFLSASVVVALSLAGCSKQGSFTVTGQLKGAIGDSLVVEEMTKRTLEIRRAIVTDANGSFTLTDTASNPRLLFIRTPENEYLTLMVLNGEQVQLSAEKGRINQTLQVTGSVQTQLVNVLNSELRNATRKLDSLGQQYEDLRTRGSDPNPDLWIQNAYQKLIQDQRAFIRSFIEKNAGEPASLMALSHQLGRQAVLDPKLDFDLFEKVDQGLASRYPESELVRNLHEYVQAMKPQLEAARELEKKIGEGKPAPEINLPDPDGKSIALSSLKGKYVLLDFWAAWCAPCRRENPNLVKAYKRFKDKGFEIFQVSLDKTREEWVGAIRQDGLNWIHVSDLKFWSSPVAREYGVEAIPASFLLDREGKIIGRNLRGAALEARLSEIFE